MSDGNDTFTLELPVRTTAAQRRELGIRLLFGRNVYNAVLNAALGRLRAMRDTRAYSRAVLMSKTVMRNGKLHVNADRRKAFSELLRAWRLTDYDLQHEALAHRDGAKYRDRLDSNTTQKIGTRVWRALSRYMYRQGGRPRFQGKGRFRSLEGKTNASGIRFDGKRLVWGKMKMPVLFDPKDTSGLQAYSLEHQVQFCRLLRREIRGRTRYYVQLVLRGKPYAKHAVGEGTVGLDFGPGIIAVYASSDGFAKLSPLAPGIEDLQAEKRRLLRKMDRSRRAMNPDCFAADGTVIRGKRLTRFSETYVRLRRQVAELSRVQEEQRKLSHNRLANEILAHGSDLRIEKVSKRGWQKHWGKTIGRRAPGLLEATLVRKAQNAGGRVEVFATVTTRLSRTCICGSIRAKSLNERVHSCECGAYAQRDLFSAFLAAYVSDGTLNLSQARNAWTGAKPLLERAWLQCRKSANGQDRLSGLGLGRCPGTELMRAKESRPAPMPIPETGNRCDEARPGMEAALAL